MSVRDMREKDKLSRRWLILYGLCWAGYLGGLTYVVLFKASWGEVGNFIRIMGGGEFPERRKVYLRLFESTMFFLQNWEYSYARMNVFGNMLLFLPFGSLSGLSWEGIRGLLLTLLFSFVVSLGYEVIQLVYSIGEFDVDDIMLNVIGALAGYGLIRLILAGWRSKTDADETI